MSTPISGDAVFQNPGGVFSSGNPAFILTATATGAAHTLHTAVAGTSSVDLVSLWVYNNSALNVNITLEVGGVDCIFTVMRNSLPALALAKIPMSNGITLKAFAATTAVIGVFISTTQLIDQAQ